MGDFAVLADLPAMYQHCKSTEDKDMTPLDFMTDHLVNVDGLFDKHQNSDEQKPHVPFHKNHKGYTLIALTQSTYSIVSTPFLMTKKQLVIAWPECSIAIYITDVFRPPNRMLISGI
jgi:hypothetical protein